MSIQFHDIDWLCDLFLIINMYSGKQSMKINSELSLKLTKTKDYSGNWFAKMEINKSATDSNMTWKILVVPETREK